MGRLTKRHGKHAVQIGGETRRNDVGWLRLADYEDMEEAGRLIEQKHGTWISLDAYVYECDGMWQCSECGEDFYFEFGTPLECRAYYCPNCGAKMELEGDHFTDVDKMGKEKRNDTTRSNRDIERYTD